MCGFASFDLPCPIAVNFAYIFDAENLLRATAEVMPAFGTGQETVPVDCITTLRGGLV